MTEPVRPADPAELTLLVAAHPEPEPLRAWVEQWRAVPTLHGARVVVVHGAEAVPPAALLEELSPAAVVALPEDRAESLATLGDLLLGAPTRFVAATCAPRSGERSVETLAQQLAASQERIAATGLEAAVPLLLSTTSAPGQAVQAYLAGWLARADELTALERDYLAFLALRQATVTVEGVDPVVSEGAVEVLARAGVERLFTEAPPWGYEIALERAGTNEDVLIVPATIEQRVFTNGVRCWENLRARVPLSGLPEGNFRVVVRVPTSTEAFRPRRYARATPGATAPARTQFLPRTGDRPASRYLVNTRGRDGHTWISVQHGDSPSDRRRWERTLLRKDLHTVLRDRSAGWRMRAARLVRLVTRPFFAHREIWIVGERADTAQDNGWHLFRHLRTTHPERAVYYVIDPASPHRERVADLGNVVAHSSWRHQLLMLHASVLANAYSINHMVPRQWPLRAYTHHLAWRVGALRVYLKHGVNVQANAVKRGTGGYDLYLAANEGEATALRTSARYGDHVQVTGLARYDALVKAPSSRTILFMPTWRRYLVPKLFGGEDAEAKIPFEGSTYQRFLQDFLSSPRLHEMLERHDYRLEFLPHYNLAQYLEDLELTSPRTSRADTRTRTFSEILGGCDAFVTDHSSVHFDVAYLGTPVVYAHFDPEEYNEGHASVLWFDEAVHGFGPVVRTADEVIDALDEILSRGCTVEPRYQANAEAAFPFRDRENCRRIVAEIERRFQEVVVPGR